LIGILLDLLPRRDYHGDPVVERAARGGRRGQAFVCAHFLRAGLLLPLKAWLIRETLSTRSRRRRCNIWGGGFRSQPAQKMRAIQAYATAVLALSGDVLAVRNPLGDRKGRVRQRHSFHSLQRERRHQNRALSSCPCTSDLSAKLSLSSPLPSLPCASLISDMANNPNNPWNHHLYGQYGQPWTQGGSPAPTTPGMSDAGVSSCRAPLAIT
jgi:hypothetical protein